MKKKILLTFLGLLLLVAAIIGIKAWQITDLIAAGNDRELVWVVYIDWLITKANGMFVLDRHALRLLRHQLSGISDQEKSSLVSQLPMVS